MHPTTKTRHAPILRIVKVLVCTRRLSTPRIVKKLFAKIEKIVNIITKTAKGKSLLSDNPSVLRLDRCVGFSISEPGLSFPIKISLTHYLGRSLPVEGCLVVIGWVSITDITG
jgi:hypothetical protein